MFRQISNSLLNKQEEEQLEHRKHRCGKSRDAEAMDSVWAQ